MLEGAKIVIKQNIQDFKKITPEIRLALGFLLQEKWKKEIVYNLLNNLLKQENLAKEVDK